MSGLDGGGSVLSLGDEMLRIQDLRDHEKSLRGLPLNEDGVSSPLEDNLTTAQRIAEFGNPFFSAAFSGTLVAAFCALIAILLFSQLAVGPAFRAEVALADRKFLNQNISAVYLITGATGPSGPSGPSGGTGAKGDEGVQGTKGDPGATGSTGASAICSPNPLFPCAKGDKGDTGGTGAKGDTGTGLSGATGPSGPSGPTGQTGATGPTGDKGNNGTTGDTGNDGPQGPPFSGVANFTGVNINGPTICAVPIDQSCLGPGGCFNFSLCVITAEGINVQGVTMPPVLVVGALGSSFGATFQLGQTGSDGHAAYFGKRFGINPTAYKTAIFQTYATSVIIEASNFFTMRSQFNVDIIAETGAITLRSQGGGIDVSATTDITFVQSGLSNGILFNAAGSWIATASYAAIQTDVIIFQSGSGSNQWYRTNPTKSLACGAGGFPPAADLTRRSQSMYTDFIMEPYPSTQTSLSGRIISNSSDGFVNIGPNIKICSNTLRSAGTTLILQGNVASDIISLSASYVTNAAIGFPITFIDAEGVDFKGTFLLNSITTSQPNDCGVIGALIIKDDLVVTQTITHNGISACASDARTKQYVKDMDIEQAHNRLMNLPLKQFEYTKEFVNGGGHMGARLNTTYYGVVAQEIKKDFGYLVDVVKRKIGEVHVDDFHALRPELLYGEMLGAMQHMHKFNLALAKRIDELEHHLRLTKNKQI